MKYPFLHSPAQGLPSLGKYKRLHFAGWAFAGLAIKSALQIYDQRIALCGFYPTHKKTQNMPAMRLGTPYLSLSHAVSLSLSLSLSMGKWVFLCGPGMLCVCVCKERWDLLPYVRFQSASYPAALHPTSSQREKETKREREKIEREREKAKSARVAKEAIKHKACR